jgi:hypothetical protein
LVVLATDRVGPNGTGFSPLVDTPFTLPVMATITSREGGTVVAAAGAGLLVSAVALYLTELSRAVGVVVAGVAAVMVVSGLRTLWRGRWPHRGLLVAFAVVVAGLVALGVWTWLSALSSPPRSA